MLKMIQLVIAFFQALLGGSKKVNPEALENKVKELQKEINSLDKDREEAKKEKNSEKEIEDYFNK